MKQRFRFQLLLYPISLTLGGFLIWYLFLFMTQVITVSALNITAPIDVHTSIPVYAQFVVAQTFVLPQVVLVNAIDVPMQINRSGDMMTFRLVQNGTPILAWRRSPPAHDKPQIIHLASNPPMQLMGNLELQISAGDILVADEEFAPRVFVESSASSYREGHYRIANNDKKGDIAIHVLQERLRYQLFLESLNNNPFVIAMGIIQCLVILLLATFLPVVIYSNVLAFYRKRIK